jgi:hypothetical protein
LRKITIRPLGAQGRYVKLSRHWFYWSDSQMLCIQQPILAYRVTLNFVSRVTWTRLVVCEKICTKSVYRFLLFPNLPPISAWFTLSKSFASHWKQLLYLGLYVIYSSYILSTTNTTWITLRLNAGFCGEVLLTSLYVDVLGQAMFFC